jgi:hypothetical protein
VRPEKIEILPLNFTVESYFYGIIEHLVYIGTDTRYIVGLTDKIKIVIRRQNISYFYRSQYSVGEKVKVNIPLENISILEENLSEKERLKLGKFRS